jgi:hypothetical protein
MPCRPVPLDRRERGINLVEHPVAMERRQRFVNDFQMLLPGAGGQLLQERVVAVENSRLGRRADRGDPVADECGTTISQKP